MLRLRDRAAALVATLLVALAAASSAQEAPAAREAPAPADLPVTRVAAFTSGVGWFEHAGTVTGTQELVLQVPAEHMDDLLQSLVLQDLDGGHVRPVRYPARDPLPRILDSYALNLAGAPTLADLLRQARGEAVRVEAGESLTGTIVGVEEVRPPDDAPRTYLTLLSDEGLRRVALAEIRDLRFESEALRAELAAALDAVARHRDADAATVRLRFEGEGERRVRIGYVREMPVWKTSYRLVVHDDDTADLQGWAILDNPTDLDLEGVAVSFVAGRPASFVTDLYEPVHVERPRVELDTGPTVVPRADAGAFEPAPAPALRSFADAAEAEAGGIAADAAASGLAPSLAGAGVEAAAEGTAAGAAFEYRVREPVTIGRHESAMIPIVRATVPVRRLALHDPTVLGERPLRGVRLTNDTGLHLAAGPVTVVGATGFAGAARLGDLPDGESRMLTHAVDPAVRVLRSRESEPRRVVRASLQGGVLESTVLERVRSEYRIEATGDAAPLLVIEHPRRAGYEIVAPDPAPALTEGGARFAVRLDGADASDTSAASGAPGAADPSGDAGDPAALPVQLRCDRGAPCTLAVVEERTEAQRVEVTDLAPDRVAFLLQNVELSDEDREALRRVARGQDDLAAIERDLASRRSRLDAIHREQERIRENMGALARDSSLYRRYVSDLEAQEDELAAIHDAIAELEARRAELQERLEEAIAELP